MYKKIIITSFLAGASCFADGEIRSSLHIYRDFSHVSEEKSVKIQPTKDGVVREYNIPEQVVGESFYVKSGDADITHKGFNKNIVTLEKILADKLMEKVRFFQTGEDGVQKTIVDGSLISLSPIMIRDSYGKIYTFVKKEDIIVEDVPLGYAIKPNLEFGYTPVKDSSEMKYTMGYLTRGIGCSGIYNVFAKQKSANLEGYMNITNNTGKSFKNVQIGCVFGDVSRVQRPGVYRPVGVVSYSAKESLEGFNPTAKKEEALESLDLYYLPKRVDLGAKSEKLYSFLQKGDVGFNYVNTISLQQDTYKRSPVKQRFDRYVELTPKEGEKNGLGFLEGVVRVYEDIDGKKVFVGEADVPFVPAGKSALFKVGKTNSLFIEEVVKFFNSEMKKEREDGSDIVYTETTVEKEFIVTNSSKNEEDFRILLTKPSDWEMKFVGESCSVDTDKCKVTEEEDKIIISGSVKKEAKVKIKYKLITNKYSRQKP